MHSNGMKPRTIVPLETLHPIILYDKGSQIITSRSKPDIKIITWEWLLVIILLCLPCLAAAQNILDVLLLAQNLIQQMLMASQIV
jgi:hypothetical protein